ncbi:MAG: glycoside hydrolase family 3 N-terminal domain-containing protein, partial [Pseudomonadota bacterium]
APILIDQEGGRVARLGPPHWRAAPPAARFGELARNDLGKGREAVRLNARLIAAELHDLGISVDCIPLLDVPVPGSHDIIGDRAFDGDPVLVAELGRAQAEGLMDGGVLPVIKHIPGHGRASADSHESLPVVSASRAALEAQDFVPFKALADLPWGMTAHVLYTDLDPESPATTSHTIIEQVIRNDIGFRNLLLTDDLSMKALKGGLAERARTSLAAGCDIALHCNGDLNEMRAVAEGAGRISDTTIVRLENAEALYHTRDRIDFAEAADRLGALLAAA